MAVAVKELTEVDRVTDATLAAYRSAGEPAMESSLAEVTDGPPGRAGALRSIVAAGARRVEIILDAGVNAEELTAVAWRLAGSGWSVVVLVACDRLGEAHPGLRGVPCGLQPWWFEGDQVRFGRVEVP